MRKELIDSLLADFRGAAHSILRDPVVSLVAILSLALGIGCTTATLTIRNAVFYKAPPLYRDPDRLSRIDIVTTSQPQRQDVPAELYRRWTEDTSLSIGAAAPGARREVRVEDTKESLSVQGVTPELFRITGVVPVLGSLFSDSGQRISNAEALLSYQVWQSLFHG